MPQFNDTTHRSYTRGVYGRRLLPGGGKGPYRKQGVMPRRNPEMSKNRLWNAIPGQLGRRAVPFGPVNKRGPKRRSY